MVSQIALGAIWGYQRWISPRKGFRCAHSVLHGGTGCSGFAKHAIRDHGLWAAIPQIRNRFRDCKAASQTLHANCPVHSGQAVHAAHPGDEIDDAVDADGSRRRARKQRRDRRRDDDRDGPCETCSGCGEDACTTPHLCGDAMRLKRGGLCNAGCDGCDCASPCGG